MSISKFSNKDTTYVNHSGIRRQTLEAICFITSDGDIWVPKQYVQAKDAEIFAIPTWFARKKGIKVPKDGFL